GGGPQLAALRDVYVALGRLALPVAQQKGTLTPDAAARLAALLDTGTADDSLAHEDDESGR
ncbi:MAG TPA: hypothetical protein VF116_01995, partial [Ktedonobacterales bacterium]